MVLILGVKLEEEITIKFWHFFSLVLFQYFGSRLCADVENMLHSTLFYDYRYLHFMIVKYTAAVADKKNTSMWD